VKGFVGNSAGWPIGLLESLPYRAIFLVEGTPDLIAAHDIIWSQQLEQTFGAICITGAKNQIHRDALPALQGKRILIVPHEDPAGHEAAQAWQDQLLSSGISTSIFSPPPYAVYNGLPAKDLNDLVAANHPILTTITKFLKR
jgi:hypothetical protein